ncbi:MAG TPA: TIGR01777 family oxidoreductase [Nitrospiraceae bacterium]|nr:TIGR01777 family oxidoreductase [Nitrospiraceae bacterium]
MRIVVAGATGFIGRPLCRFLVEKGHQVTALSRTPEKSRAHLPPTVAIVGWDGLTTGPWERTLVGADALINLSGEPIAEGRWTAARKQTLRESRIGTTRLLVQALSRLSSKPRTLINASAIGYYGPRDPTPVTEETKPGSDFLAGLCVDWEQEARQAEALGLRVVRLRIGIVLDKDGGVLLRMVPPFRYFLGGPISPGHQWISWIHRQDLIGLVHWALDHPTISGAVNAVAPGAVTMREFCRTLGHVLGRPSWLPVPELVLRLMLGELAMLMTTGQRVEPAIALREGFVFQYSSLEPALKGILKAP